MSLLEEYFFFLFLFHDYFSTEDSLVSFSGAADAQSLATVGFLNGGASRYHTAASCTCLRDRNHRGSASSSIVTGRDHTQL